LATRGDDLTGEGRHAEAGEAYRAAAELAPDNHELLFWAGLAEFGHGDREEGLAQLRRAIALQPGWRALMGRLEPDVAPAAARALAALDDA
jgi:tetratricopeptide (TPR) repeat protein